MIKIRKIKIHGFIASLLFRTLIVIVTVRTLTPYSPAVHPTLPSALTHTWQKHYYSKYPAFLRTRKGLAPLHLPPLLGDACVYIRRAQYISPCTTNNPLHFGIITYDIRDINIWDKHDPVITKHTYETNTHTFIYGLF